jgi:hypothetical protein
MIQNAILLSHVFVRGFEAWKWDLLEKCIRSWRLFNPETYIVLTGHGGLLPHHINTLVNFCHWEEAIKEEQIDTGHHHFVQLGLKHLKQIGCKYVFKSRADCVCCLPAICNYSHNILDIDNTLMLTTEMTSFDNLYLGDLFLYSSVDRLLKVWDKWNYKQSGLITFATNWAGHLAHTDTTMDWRQLLRNTVSYRDISSLQCINVSDFWSVLHDKNLLEIDDYSRYGWGVKPQYVKQLSEALFYDKQ